MLGLMAAWEVSSPSSSTSTSHAHPSLALVNVFRFSDGNQLVREGIFTHPCSSSIHKHFHQHQECLCHNVPFHNHIKYIYTYIIYQESPFTFIYNVCTKVYCNLFFKFSFEYTYKTEILFMILMATSLACGTAQT